MCQFDSKQRSPDDDLGLELYHELTIRYAGRPLNETPRQIQLSLKVEF